MIKRQEDPEREDRIAMEIIVDAYGPEERALGWYYYLEENIQFPCIAKCSMRRAISPLQVGEKVDLISMAPEDECQYEIFVMIHWGNTDFAVPLSQLKPIHGTEETMEAIEDWIYWMEKGYEF